jgi:hypothetical protein
VSRPGFVLDGHRQTSLLRSVIPQLLIDYFEPMHINIMFDELQDRFGFPKKQWRKRFDDFLQSQSRNTSELDAFVKFGNRFINPVLNNILCRRELHTTFNKMLLYIIEKHSIPKYGKRLPNRSR